MTKIVCDRCHREIKDSTKSITITVSDANVVWGSTRTLDLCSTCYFNFNRFMESYPGTEE